jgi:hypothetical protein
MGSAMRSSTSMRLALALGLPILAASLTACNGGSKAAVATTPSGFAVQPRVSDPLCNGGRGVRLPARFGLDSVLASATVADGSTLIAISDYSAKRSVVLHSVTRRCAPNSEFGRHGVATIGISPRPPRTRPAGSDAPSGLRVNAVAARNGGGAILAGSFGSNWVVGEVSRRGQLDSTFGNGGWTVLPFQGEVTAIVQEPSGRIVIGGDNAGGGCCLVNWAAALSARGQLEREFGKRGRTRLRAPTLEAGIGALMLKPNGDILAAVAYGNNGCWGVALAMLTPSGHRVPRFAQRTDRFWQRLGFNAYVGDIYTDAQGFTLVGTGQRPCVGASLSSAPSATGLIMRFRTNGEPIGNVVRYPSRMYGDVLAFHAGHGTFVVESTYADPTRLTLTARRPDGSIDPRFGSHGRARIHTPWRGPNAALDTTVLINQASPNAVVLVATSHGRNQLQIIRVRL